MFYLSGDEMIKHWLLNLAVEMPRWLGSLFPDVVGETLNVHPVLRSHADDYEMGSLNVFGMVGFDLLMDRLRGLNQNHNHGMKEIFKSAATRASWGTLAFQLMSFGSTGDVRHPPRDSKRETNRRIPPFKKRRVGHLPTLR